MIDHSTEAKKAFLISVSKLMPKGGFSSGMSQKEIAIEHLDELEALVETQGLAIVGKAQVFIKNFDPATQVTKGKLEELVQEADKNGAEVIIFDDEIAPSQGRNLEKSFGRAVIDRTEVILDVFAKRAKTKEAKLQIELAQVRYQAPRLKRLWTHLSRQAGTGSSGGGGAYLKGEGEKQIEIDRRILKAKIDDLQTELEKVKQEREVLRVKRVKKSIPTFACVGYTNAGKSTLMSALTGASLFIEDKLFATLDTTTRKMHLKNNQEILMTDTVGFIRKLPHLLVAAFKSTLEESLESDILLHVVDASHPMAEEQAKTTFEVLQELGIENKTIITLLNKVDRCQGDLEKEKRIGRLAHQYPHTLLISASLRQGFHELEEKMIELIAKLRSLVSAKIPQSRYELISEAMQCGEILETKYEGNDVIITARLPTPFSEKWRKEGWIIED